MPYEILEHSADEKFRAQGQTLEEAFKNVVKAISEIVGGGTGQYRHTIEVESENLDALLYDFIDELIFLQETEGVTVSHTPKINVKDLKQNGWKINATIKVDPIKPGKTALDLKSPTYNEMKTDYIQNEGWTLEAVIDV